MVQNEILKKIENELHKEVMFNIYKVTATTIEKTQKGYELYNLQLNKSLWVTKFVPLSNVDRAFDPLYKLYAKNNKTLDFLVGCYIAVDLKNSKYGTNFGQIRSFDVLRDFKKLLDESNGKASLTQINVFGFLEAKGYPINSEGTITLKEPYSNLNIKIQSGCTICYPNKPEEDTLTLVNIGLIYDNFFKDKYIDNGNPDRDEQYDITPVAIIKTRKVFHKTKSSVISTGKFDVLRIGDRLSMEQCQFLTGTLPIGTQ